MNTRFSNNRYLRETAWALDITDDAFWTKLDAKDANPFPPERRIRIDRAIAMLDDRDRRIMTELLGPNWMYVKQIDLPHAAAGKSQARINLIVRRAFGRFIRHLAEGD